MTSSWPARTVTKSARVTNKPLLVLGQMADPHTPLSDIIYLVWFSKGRAPAEKLC